MKAILLAIGLLMVSLPAQAGYVEERPVGIFIFDGSGNFDGAMLGTRFTEDSIARIGCYVVGAPGSFGVWANCLAVDSNGVGAFCFTNDPAIVDSVKAITAYSAIQVDFDSSGQCTGVTVMTFSHFIPDFRDLGLGAPGNSGGKGQ